MRLREERIEKIAEDIVEALVSGGYIETADEEDTVLAIRDIIFDDLNVEDELDEEVREILLQYEDEIDKGRLEYHKMFRLVKDKLIRERNLIL